MKNRTASGAVSEFFSILRSCSDSYCGGWAKPTLLRQGYGRVLLAIAYSAEAAASAAKAGHPRGKPQGILAKENKQYKCHAKTFL